MPRPTPRPPAHAPPTPRAAPRPRAAAPLVTYHPVRRAAPALAATGPVLEEAGSRSTAAWAALRG
ncbi:hypothetical protein ACFV5C_04870, partial [Streptomyces sp. NPDC059762]